MVDRCIGGRCSARQANSGVFGDTVAIAVRKLHARGKPGCSCNAGLRGGRTRASRG